jgi:hypothetical protein
MEKERSIVDIICAAGWSAAFCVSRLKIGLMAAAAGGLVALTTLESRYLSRFSKHYLCRKSLRKLMARKAARTQGAPAWGE